jgi:hypothetical protein
VTDQRLTFREFVAGILILLFAYALWMNPTSETIIGALLTAFATAYGYYLGGSKVGADTATKNADTVSQQANANAAPAPPADAAEAAQQTAAAAQDEADAITGKA